MKMDIIHISKNASEKPERDFYCIFENRNGEKIYYRSNLNFWFRYQGLYGIYSGKWSYTCNDADKVIGA
jgi:hypothetical protein